MRCLTDAGIPSNEGCKRPIQVIAPPGSLVNARSPAAVMQRMIVCHSIVDLIMGALAEAIPERVMGDSCGCLYNYCMAIHRSEEHTSELTSLLRISFAVFCLSQQKQKTLS